MIELAKDRVHVHRVEHDMKRKAEVLNMFAITGDYHGFDVLHAASGDWHDCNGVRWEAAKSCHGYIVVVWKVCLHCMRNISDLHVRVHGRSAGWMHWM
jgi:hypothetical protein